MYLSISLPSSSTPPFLRGNHRQPSSFTSVFHIAFPCKVPLVAHPPLSVCVCVCSCCSFASAPFFLVFAPFFGGEGERTGHCCSLTRLFEIGTTTTTLSFSPSTLFLLLPLFALFRLVVYRYTAVLVGVVEGEVARALSRLRARRFPAIAFLTVVRREGGGDTFTCSFAHRPTNTEEKADKRLVKGTASPQREGGRGGDSSSGGRTSKQTKKGPQSIRVPRPCAHLFLSAYSLSLCQRALLFFFFSCSLAACVSATRAVRLHTHPKREKACHHPPPPICFRAQGSCLWFCGLSSFVFLLPRGQRRVHQYRQKKKRKELKPSGGYIHTYLYIYIYIYR